MIFSFQGFAVGLTAFAVAYLLVGRYSRGRIVSLTGDVAALQRLLARVQGELATYTEKYRQHRQLAIDEGIRAINAENALAKLREQHNIRQSPPTPAAPTFTPSDPRD